MSPSPLPPLLQTLVHLQNASPSQAKEWHQKYQRRQSQTLSLSDFLLQSGQIPSSQLNQALAVTSRGYYHCAPCRRAFPLASGESTPTPGRTCPQCQNSLQGIPPLGAGKTTDIATLSTHQPNTPTGETSRPHQTQLARRPAPPLHLGEVLGQGGYGAVYRVTDPQTGRNMALKVLRGRGAKKAGVIKRFQREIQITANLEHPHIMPVYESGYLADGSLYFAMKEFRGGSLKDLLEKKAPPPLTDRLHIFLKVCDAIAYAHSRGVIHRDLKPDNIAVGKFGEVMVMDWGIARMVGIDEPEPDLEDLETRESDLLEVGGETLTMGGIMGTPGYLSPEQARNQDVDQTSDVYGLGAVLYHLLTGDPPYTGSGQNRLVQCLMQDVVPPHVHAADRSIPAELSAVAVKALARERDDRYQKVNDLKRDIERFLEGFSVSAKQDNIWELAVKWVRRNRLLAGAGASMVVLVIIGLLATNWWLAREKAGKVEALVEKAQSLLEKRKVPTGEEFFQTHQSHYQGGKEEPVAVRRKRQTFLKHYLEARRLLEQAWELDRNRQEAQGKLFAVEREIGRLALLGENYLLAETSFERCLTLAGEERGRPLLKELEDAVKKRIGAKVALVDKIVEKLAQAPPKAGMLEEHYTQIVRQGSPEVVKKLLELLDSPHLWVRRLAVEALGRMGDTQTEFQEKDTVEWLMARLEKISIEEDLKDNLKEAEAIVWALGRLRDPRAGDLVYRVRLKAGGQSIFWTRTEIPYRWLPLPEASNQKGNLQMEMAKRAQKFVLKKEFDQAIKLLNLILEKNPNQAHHLHNRGLCYFRKKNWKAAARDFRRSIELDPEHFASYFQLATVYYRQRRFHKAVQLFTKALPLKPQSFAIYNNRAQSYVALKKYRLALADFKKAFEIKPDSNNHHLNFASCYGQMGKYDLALKHFQKQLELNPREVKAHMGIGGVYKHQGKLAKSLESYNRAIDLDPQQGEVYFSRGQVYEKMNKPAQALRDFTRAIQYNPEYEPYLARGNLYYQEGKYDLAQKDCLKALEMYPHLPLAHANLGVIYFHKKKFSLAFQHLGKAIELQPKKPSHYVNRAGIYGTLKKYDLAIGDLKKALQLDPRDVGALHALGLTYFNKKQYPQAFIHFNRALEIHPRHFQTLLYRGGMYMNSGKLDLAIRDLKKAVQVNPRLVTAQRLLGVIHHRKGQPKIAARYFQKVIKLNPNYPEAAKFRNYIRQHLGE